MNFIRSLHKWRLNNSAIPSALRRVRMVLDAAKQSSGQAGEYQVAGVKTVGTFNVGRSGTTNCSFIVGV